MIRTTVSASTAYTTTSRGTPALSTWSTSRPNTNHTHIDRSVPTSSVPVALRAAGHARGRRTAAPRRTQPRSRCPRAGSPVCGPSRGAPARQGAGPRHPPGDEGPQQHHDDQHEDAEHAGILTARFAGPPIDARLMPSRAGPVRAQTCPLVPCATADLNAISSTSTEIPSWRRAVNSNRARPFSNSSCAISCRAGCTTRSGASYRHAPSTPPGRACGWPASSPVSSSCCHRRAG
jgi:hypothetical protein